MFAHELRFARGCQAVRYREMKDFGDSVDFFDTKAECDTKTQCGRTSRGQLSSDLQRQISTYLGRDELARHWAPLTSSTSSTSATPVEVRYRTSGLTEMFPEFKRSYRDIDQLVQSFPTLSRVASLDPTGIRQLLARSEYRPWIPEAASLVSKLDEKSLIEFVRTINENNLQAYVPNWIKERIVDKLRFTGQDTITLLADGWITTVASFRIILFYLAGLYGASTDTTTSDQLDRIWTTLIDRNVKLFDSVSAQDRMLTAVTQSLIRNSPKLTQMHRLLSMIPQFNTDPRLVDEMSKLSTLIKLNREWQDALATSNWDKLNEIAKSGYGEYFIRSIDVDQFQDERLDQLDRVVANMIVNRSSAQNASDRLQQSINDYIIYDTVFNLHRRDATLAYDIVRGLKDEDPRVSVIRSLFEFE